MCLGEEYCMKEIHTSEELEYRARGEEPEEKAVYTPRPKWQLAVAWTMAVIVLLAFLGTCYWLMFG